MIKIFAEGNLVKDASTFNYGDGKTGISFDIASNDPGFDKAEFLRCTMFNRGEDFAQYLRKGNQVIVMGRYTKNDEGYVSCIVDDFRFGAKRD